MAEKTYYWIKLQMDFFKSPAVRLLRRMSGGDTYALIYLELILVSLENSGYIYFTGIGKDFVEELSLVLNEEAVDIDFLLTFLTSKQLIEFSDDNAFKFADDVVEGLIGKETSAAKRVRAYRKRQKQIALQSNGGVTDRNTEIELDKDLDLELEKESEKRSKTESADATPALAKSKKTQPVKHKYGEYKNVLLSDTQLQKLQAEFPKDWQARIERVSGYVQSSGKHYKDYLATIRNWAKRDKEQQAKGRANSFTLENRDVQDSDVPW